MAIPASIHDSLTARLDRLAPVKEVAQLAATIGRTFGDALLRAVAPMTDEALDEALAQLEAAELVFRRGVAPDIVYDFEHALVQEAAYRSQRKGARQGHHARIARTMSESFPDIAEHEPEIVAHHFSEGGLPEQAIGYWQEAGQRAMRRSAHVEAEGHLRHGLAQLDDVPENERQPLEIALQNMLGVCMMPTRGFGNPDVAQAFARSAELSQSTGDERALFVALRGAGQYKMISGDMRGARQQTRQILDLAEGIDDHGFTIEAHHLGWSSACFAGDFAASRAHALDGVALYDRERDHHLTFVYSGHDPGMCCRSFGSLSLWQLGYADQALLLCEEGLALAESLGHPFTTSIALWGAGFLHLLRRDMAAVYETGDTLARQAEQHGYAAMAHAGRALRGGALAATGGRLETAKGIAELRAALDQLRASRTVFGMPSFFAVLGAAYARSGDVEAGLGAIEEGLAMAETNGDFYCLPELHRLAGVLSLARTGAGRAKAEARFVRAVDVARHQQARMLELRAATELARLRRDRRETAAARDLLAPLYAGFTEGFDSPDLKDAKTVLDEPG